MSSQPMVSCIMPTYNRRNFVPLALRYFLRQDYTDKELIILDDGSDPVKDLIPEHSAISYVYLSEKITLGEKLNRAAEMSKGDIILQWDDDDWYAKNRISYQVNTLLEKQKDLCGINQLYYYNLISKEAFKYSYPRNLKPWLLGSSLCFKRELWEHHKFVHTNIGMDGRFVWGVSPDRIEVLDDHSFAVHMIHNNNVCPKRTSGEWWQHYPKNEIVRIMGEDWNLYEIAGKDVHVSEKRKHLKSGVNGFKTEPVKPVKNVFACLVHEKKDCINDLVKNLHYHDPDSVILLYNGGADNTLLDHNSFPYQKFNAVIHPSPVPQHHGYLHGFAIDSMRFAIQNYSFDTFTIVDSDQLCIRKGYSKYLGEALTGINGKVGLFSSDAQRVTEDNGKNHIALQAHKEHQLWRPFLKKFKDGEDHFVYWTFWPSTIFTIKAIRDLLKLFERDRDLQNILKHSKIWAMEEVLFPTLVSLLGYDIRTNPCSYNYVKYRKAFLTSDLKRALTDKEVYWMHPVPREYNHVIRKNIRIMNNSYAGNTNSHNVTVDQRKMPDCSSSGKCFFSIPDLLNRVAKIKGWLSPEEADLLVTTCINACIEHSETGCITETGSYHGKSAILFGNIVKAFFPAKKVYAVDPLNGIVGAEDQKLVNEPPTFESFRQNIENEELTKNVHLIRDYSYNVSWDQAIALFFVDGLHDYANVSRDFRHFENYICHKGYVAFHDYADYYPGVITFVDELIATGNYKKICQAGSLIILKKVIDPNTENKSTKSIS